MFKLEPKAFRSTRRRISSSSALLRRKKVPKFCSRLAWPRTKAFTRPPRARPGDERRKDSGRCAQPHLIVPRKALRCIIDSPENIQRFTFKNRKREPHHWD